MPDTSFYAVHGDTLTLRVKAKPGARQDAVLGLRGDELLVSVRAAPEKGKATAEVARVIAEAVGVPRERIVLRLGGASPHKVFQAPAAAAAALQRLAERGKGS